MFDRVLCIAEYSAMNISPVEAEKALKEIEASRVAMRSVIRSHRGHLYLWLWGCVWIAMSLLNWAEGARYWAANIWILVAGLAATFVIGYVQAKQIRTRIDKRFVAVCATLLVFGYGVWPIFTGGFHSEKAAFGYGTLLWMQLYVVAGIWFDNYLLWVGIVATALIVAGFLLLPAFFWGLTLLAGLTLFGSGFYVRHFWR